MRTCTTLQLSSDISPRAINNYRQGGPVRARLVLVPVRLAQARPPLAQGDRAETDHYNETQGAARGSDGNAGGRGGCPGLGLVTPQRSH